MSDTYDIDIDLTVCGWPESHTAKVTAKDYWDFRCPEHEWEVLSVKVQGIEIIRLLSSDQIQEIVNYLAIAEESRGDEELTKYGGEI